MQEQMKNKKNGNRASFSGMARALCAVALAGAAGLAMGGCQKAIDAKDLAADPTQTSTSFDNRMDFWHTLATDRICSNDEAFHGLLLYIEKADQARNYEERVKLMKDLGMLAPGFDGKSNEAVTRGVVAVAVVKVLEIKGGIFLHLFDKSERYATRELVYEDVYPPSTPNQVFSGSEFVGIIGRIEDYQRTAPRSAQVAASKPSQGQTQASTQGDEAAKSGLESTSPPTPEVGNPVPGVGPSTP
jgi:hypothetical protein